MFLVLKRRRLDLFSLMERSLTWWHCQLRFESIFIPMYLTLSLIFYCIILFLNHLQIYFAWTLRFHFFFIIYGVKFYLGLTDWPDALSQHWLVCSVFWWSYYSFVIDILSSAKSWTLQIFFAQLRLLKCNKNRRDPRTDPWVVPQFIVQRSVS